MAARCPDARLRRAALHRLEGVEPPSSGTHTTHVVIIHRARILDLCLAQGIHELLVGLLVVLKLFAVELLV